jgi:hypothetical protein
VRTPDPQVVVDSDASPIRAAINNDGKGMDTMNAGQQSARIQIDGRPASHR